MDIVSALRTFLRVAETGSFSAAAAGLNLTQPAVSRQISALESHFNTRLLHRTTNCLSLTAEGERVLPIALQILGNVDDIGDALYPDGTRMSGKVKLSLPAPLGLLLSDRLPELLAAYPNISLELSFREQASDLIEQGIDLEVRVGAVADSSLICRRIGWTTAFLVASPSYIARRPPPKIPADIAAHDCICYTRGGHGRSWLFPDGSEDIAVPISPRLVADNALSVHRATLAGAGLAVLSHIIAVPDISAGRLIHLMRGFPPARLPIYLVYPSRRNIPLRVKIVLDFLAALIDADPSMSMRTFTSPCETPQSQGMGRLQAEATPMSASMTR
jgi:DNA-binding transcriptional LysR family regulator